MVWDGGRHEVPAGSYLFLLNIRRARGELTDWLLASMGRGDE